MNIKLFIISVVFASLALAGCTTTSAENIAQVDTVPTEEIAQEAIQPSQEETAPPAASADFQNYTDPYSGISLNYPKGWYLESSALSYAQESLGYSVSFFSYDFNAPRPEPVSKGQSGLPEGGTKVEVTVWKENLTLEEVVAQQRDGGGTVTGEEYVTLSNGLEAVILNFEGFSGDGRTLITNIGDKIVFVTAYGNLDAFMDIAMSLQTGK